MCNECLFLFVENCFTRTFKDVAKLLIRVHTGWKEIQNEMKTKKSADENFFSTDWVTRNYTTVTC